MTKARLIRWASYLIVAASFVFIALSIARMDFASVEERIAAWWIPAALGASIFYSLANVILALNWCTGLWIITGEKVPRVFEILLIYLKTGIAKYLPSNLVHFATRHYLVTRFNFSHRVMLLANVFEIAFLCMTAFVIVSAGVSLGLLTIPPKIYAVITSWRMALLAAGGLIAAAAALWWFGPARIKEYLVELVRVRKLPIYFLLLVSYSIYFAVTATILAFIFGSMLGVSRIASNIPFVFVGYTLAWVTGYLVPGAPGGLGVREVVLLLVFSPRYGEATVIAAAVILRTITVIGDVITFLYGVGYRTGNPLPIDAE